MTAGTSIGRRPVIGRADRDGSDVNQYFLATGDLPVWGVAVQGRRLYFSGTGDIGRANLDGSGLNTILIADGTHNVATYGNHVYGPILSLLRGSDLDDRACGPRRLER